MAHELLEIGTGCPDEQMEMVPHEDKAEYRNLVNLTGPFKELQKGDAILIGSNDLLAGVASARHMLVSLGELDAQGTSHKESRLRDREKSHE